MVEAFEQYGLEDVLGVTGTQTHAHDDPPQQGSLRQEDLGELDVRRSAARLSCKVCIFDRHNPHLSSRALELFIYLNAPGAVPVEKNRASHSRNWLGIDARYVILNEA